MNARIFKILAERETSDDRVEYDKLHQITTPENLAVEFQDFLVDNGFQKAGGWDDSVEIIASGKNFAGFDKPLILLIPQWESHINLHRRSVDPTSNFINWKEDKYPPNLNKCMKRAGVEGVVTHDALNDAWDVIQVNRFCYNKGCFCYDN